MKRGRVWPAEAREYADPLSGARVRQLTDYMGHSHHLYFTNPGWHDGGRRLLVGSDRANRTNLFSVHLESGEIAQLTDLEPAPPPYATCFLNTSVNPTREEAYFWYGRQVVALDLGTLERRPLWEAPEGFRRSMLNTTADGRSVCAGIYEDLSHRFRIDLLHGYVGFRETFEALPLSRIVRIAADGTGAETVWEEKTWIGHVNTSPTRPNLLTFCHEGPWELVDNRIWGLDLAAGKAWPIRPREGDERVGHEYWLADGTHVAYHGGHADGRGFFGRVRFDDTGRVEAAAAGATGHMHSNAFSLIVGDAGKVVRIWRYDGERFLGPRVLCEHRSSCHIQQVHVHPRFTPDGRQVVYTSDSSGYGNVYLVDVPPFESLPEMNP